MKVKSKPIRAILLEDEDGRKYVIHKADMYKRAGEKSKPRKK